MNNQKLVLGKRETKNPTWQQVQDAIKLVGSPGTSDTMMLQAVDSELPWLTIGGCLEERYYLSIELVPAETWVLIDREQSDEHVNVAFPFGEWEMMPRRHLVNAELVFKAAHHYFDFVVPNPELDWEKHGTGVHHS